MHIEELQDLLKRMTDTSYFVGGRQSISWNAHREAERINDVSLISYLKDLISLTKDKRTKRNIYFILGHIGKNTGDKQALEILISRIKPESDKYVLSSLFEDIARQPKIVDCKPIVDFIFDERWLVRHSAILALENCKSPLAEDTLINVLNKTSNPCDISYAVKVLSKIGSSRSIPILTKFIRHPKDDTKCSAINALMELGNSSLTPVFIEALKDRSPAAKSYAIVAINKHGDESAVDAVINRVKAFISKKRKEVVPIEEFPKSEVIVALQFLARYEQRNEKVKEVFKLIKNKKWDKLFDCEKMWLRDNIHFFK